MPDLEAQIKAWRAELARTGIAREVVDELEGHLRERVERLTASELSEPEAFQMAGQQLGDGKILKTEFAKLKRGPWRILRGNPLGLNLLAVWFLVTGLGYPAWELRRFCQHCLSLLEEVLQNYSFKGVGPILPGGLDWNAIFAAGIFILIGHGLLRRWRICQAAALVVALTQIYFNTFYYFALGHPNLGVATNALPVNVEVHTLFLGVSLPYWFSYLRRYVGLVILIWGVCSLLRLWGEKLFRRTVVE